MSQKTIDYIYNSEWELFAEYKAFLPEVSPILKIGHGLGFSTKFIASYNNNVRAIDVGVPQDAIATEHAVLYKGYPIPFENSSVDTVVAIYSLHHIKNPVNFFTEMVRVSARRIILAEETYDNILQKVFLYLRDAQVHKLQGVEECGLHWESYFSRKDIRELFVELGVSITHHVSKRKNSYYKELFILDIL